jgi:DNA mismatch endonuclease (patch repair protein)
MDKFSKKKRSEIMSKIKSKNTKFEKEFIAVLKKFTNRKFKTNVSSIKGKPDIVFIKEKICIFLDSDFWHGWQYTRRKHLLKNSFWRKKIEATRKRDKKITIYLRNSGWRVIRIWEHEIKKNPEKAVNKIINF